ncbi:phosphotransferase [Clostridium nigeriense]|uniref:phosphotransferase n=1 Tax=Clostridium nigeriense TaxID=1805470 RepID=UPI003D348322
MDKKSKKIPITKIGGLNNSNYLIELQDEKYVLRIPSSDNTNNFYSEHDILSLIKHYSISPEILYHNKDNGILLSKYMESSKFNLEFYNSTTFINTLVNTLKKLHNLECTTYFNPFNEIYNNISFLNSVNFIFNHDINLLITKLKDLEIKLCNKIHYGLCHNDLNTSNILSANNFIYLIDFEFSGMGDIFFDLATISWFLKDEIQDYLIKKYFGYFDIELKEKLKDYLYVVKLWNATWSYKKSIDSKSDYDYRLGGNMILDDLINY